MWWIYHGIRRYTMVYYNIRRYTMVYHGIPHNTFDAKSWNNVVEIPRYTTVYYGIPWYTMTYRIIRTVRRVDFVELGSLVLPVSYHRIYRTVL